MLRESENIEFKREATPELCKSVIAFANSHGGKIYIGINDDGDNFEVMRSLEQNLSFKEAAQIFAKEGVAFDESKYYALGLCNLADGLYTNLAFLLSDQCQHSVKVAVFEDNENTIFKTHREFKGSLFEQMEKTFEFLMLCNKNRSTFNGLTRVDTWDYPEEAIREALLNAIVHRDYSYSGSIIINVNKNCIEFISLGGLLPGLAPEDIKSGISQPRNEKLAEIFHRLNYIESYGTGIRRIFALYKNYYGSPQISVTPHTFKIKLLNLHSLQKPSVSFVAEKVENLQYANAQQRQVLAYLQKHEEISAEELQDLLGLKRTRAYLIDNV
ncbi:MAG: ATP-binding protein [Phascolarctobacterium sp.]